MPKPILVQTETQEKKSRQESGRGPGRVSERGPQGPVPRPERRKEARHMEQERAVALLPGSCRGIGGGPVLDLDLLEKQVMEAPEKTVAQFIADALPVLRAAEEVVRAAAMKRMTARSQKEMPLDDGRKVVMSATPIRQIDEAKLLEARLAFESDGHDGPDVKALYEETRWLRLTPEICMALGINPANLDPETIQIRKSVAGWAEIKKLLKLGGAGAEIAKSAVIETPGRPKLTVEGKRKADPARLESVQRLIKEGEVWA